MSAPLARVFNPQRLINEPNGEHCSLSQSARAALAQTGYWHLRKVDLKSDGQSLTILGEVPSYFLKQLAQTAVMSIAGARHVENRLSVAGSY